MKKIRLNMDVTPDVRTRLEGLAKESESSLTETFRKALSLYEQLLDHSKQGGKIILREPDGSEESVRFL